MRRSYFPPQYCNTMKDQRINGLLPDPLQIFPRGTSPRTDFPAFLLVIMAGTKLMKKKKKSRNIVTFWLNQVAAVFKEYKHVEACGGACGQQ